MLSNISSLKGFIFDLDGTLMHSTLDFNAIRNAISCPANIDILSFVAGLQAEQKRLANQIIIEHEINDAQGSAWIEGAHEFIQLLLQLKYPIAIVTRNCRQAASIKMGQSAGQIKLLLTREDAPPKPDPTSLLQIAELWEIDVTKLAYIGDYLYDVQAANNAGMLSCLYAPGELPVYASQANVVFEHFNQLSDAVKSR
ncbi:HAD-IA family hydrolase [Aliiglaciecola sp. LCG003]|uniref:HAD family hydrolase n=1 Tax=Aliiglaciecola sp. LCG003 TaxID=3053655 RepID=UPI00257259BD|nr:HAD-IA family hydrolase [Aliiglaciecola sp. LCG003]WJG10733.1 HAD-IA family hydrolase [Aliiglaciecola sp. LCG003]